MTPRLTIHEAGNGFIGRLSVSDEYLMKSKTAKSQKGQASTAQTIFVLDRSGSMGQNVQRMTSIIIPGVARRYFKLAADDTYTLITFDSVTETSFATVAEFERSSIRERGCTNMAGVFPAIMKSINPSNPSVRIVAISDGEVHDTAETMRAAEQAASALKHSLTITATAVRLLTSQCQPDTRALASILQLNTASAASIVDIKASGTADGIEAIIDTIGAAVGSDGSGMVFTLGSDSLCFQRVPWAAASQKVHVNDLRADKPTTIWLAQLPSNPTLNGLPIPLDHGDRVTHDTLHILLEDKISYLINRLRILKVLNSPSAKDELTRVVAYFEQLENALPPPTDLSPLLEDRTLAGRAQYMKASLGRRLKSVTMTMQKIANDERVANLNLAQQADYLRQAGDGMSRNAKALARRAEDSGMDFSATMRAEILTIAAHMNALDEVDDSQHAVSFYSSATTLEGIRYIAELAKDPEILSNLTAADMLRLFNIVGIPAVAPLGDFPDPMTYRVEKFLYGTYVSVADITMALHQGGALMAPGHSEQIVTAVPFFEDRRIQQFLQRYARSSLEYISSIGMRRMIAEVPKTYTYTICAGVWKMVEELDRLGKSEIRIKNFQRLVLTYVDAVEGHFEYILPFLESPQDPAISYNLGYNGVTNMIAPILHKIRNRETLHMARILRALFSFEAYQVMRRVVRGGGPNARQDALDKILGVDFSCYRATALPRLFTRTETQHCREAVVDAGVLSRYTKELRFVAYSTLLEPLFKALIHSENPTQAVQAVEPMSNESIRKALELPASMTLDDFMLFNVVEALLCTQKADRVDKETDLPKLGDLGRPGVGTKMIERYVASRYEADYNTRLKAQSDKEQAILQDELFELMLSTKSPGVFEACIKEGKSRGPVSVMIDSPNCPGISRLHKRLMDLNEKVPERAAKLYIIYSGRSSLGGDKVFNGGNLYLCDWEPLRALLSSVNEEECIWHKLQEELRTRGHIYRGGSDSANRHGHSNDCKSYFAYGCKSLTEYHSKTGEAAWCTYIANHKDCCGVAEFLARAQAASLSS